MIVNLVAAMCDHCQTLSDPYGNEAALEQLAAEAGWTFEYAPGGTKITLCPAHVPTPA